MSPRKENLILAGIVAAGLIARVIAVVFAPVSPHGGDEALYCRLGAELATTFSYPQTIRPPLYPVVIALFYWLTKDFWPVLWFQSPLSLAWIPLVQNIGKRLGLSPANALVAAGITGLYLPFIVYPAWSWLSETLFVTIVLVGLWAGTRRQPFWSGLSWGLSALARTTGIPLGIGQAIAEKGYRAVLLFLLGFVIFPGLWLARNIVSRGQVGLYPGYPTIEGVYQDWGPDAPGTNYAPPENPGPETLLWRLRNPQTVPVLLLKKASFLTLPYRGVNLRNVALGNLPGRVTLFIFLVLPDFLLLVVGGFYLTFFGIRRRALFPLTWIWLSTLAFALILHGETRLMLPVMPGMILGAALFVQERPKIRPWMWISWGLFIALLVLGWALWCIPFYAHHP